MEPKRVRLLKETLGYEAGEIGTLITEPTNNGGDLIWCKGWVSIKFDKGGSVSGDYTNGVDYEECEIKDKE